MCHFTNYNNPITTNQRQLTNTNYHHHIFMKITQNNVLAMVVKIMASKSR